MKKIILLLFTVLTVLSANSQSASPYLISSSGDSFHNSAYLLDWSLGECMTATFDAGNYVLAQGFHQNTYVVTSVEDFNPDLEISVYPNPATSILSIKFPDVQKYDVLITLSDFTGKVLFQKQMLIETERLNLSSFACGVYILNIEQKNQQLKSFTIIKN